MSERARLLNPPPDDRALWQQVICPDCLNENRNARRRCKGTGGMCKGTGYTWKTGDYPRCPECNQPETDHAADCLAVN